MTPEALKRVRVRLGLSQERMAAVLGTSFVSVNRWEGGHSTPLKSVTDLYLALEAALSRGVAPEKLVRISAQERPLFLRDLFSLAYPREGGV